MNAAEAKNLANYQVLEPGTRGSFKAKNAKAVKLKSAV